MTPRVRPLLLLALFASMAAGCSGAGASGGGLEQDDLTRDGEDSCAIEDAFRLGLKEAGLPTRLRDEDEFDPVILHTDSQEEADSADSTVLYDTKGALLICRYRVGDDLRADMSTRYFGPTEDRTGFEDAEAWRYALDDSPQHGLSEDERERLTARFEDAPVGRALSVPNTTEPGVVVKIRAAGGAGASAALALEFTGDDPKLSASRMRKVAEAMARELGGDAK